MSRKVMLGSRGEVEIPFVNAGVLEDCEEEMRRLLAFSSKGDPLPLGKDMGAVITVLYATLKDVIPDLSRDEVRRAINMKSVFRYTDAIAEAFGFQGGDAPGEAVSPPSST